MKDIRFSKFIFLIFIGLFYSCASIKKYDETDLKPINNISEIEGEYSNRAFENENLKYKTVQNIIDFRKKIKDTTEFESVKIIVLDNKNIQFTFKAKNEKEAKYETEYELKENGFIYLKNNNFRLTGLPYIFGGYQINKTELGLTKQNELVLNGIKIDEGAILVILPASIPKTNFTNKYKRI